MRNGELEDRSEDVTQNAIQRDKEMKYMKKRISDIKESKRVQQKSIRNFRSNIWTYKVWKLFRIDSRHETSHSGSSVTPKKKKYIHIYPSQWNNRSEKKNLESNKMNGDGTKTGPKANFSTVTETEARRQWNTLFTVLRENT